MAQRAYRRDKNGQFAGSGGGSFTTYGKAGGFANKAFAARAASSNKRPVKNAYAQFAKAALLRSAVAGGALAAVALSDPTARQTITNAIGGAAADNRASRGLAASRGLGRPTQVTKKSLGGAYKITTARSRIPRSNRARISTGKKVRR